MTNKIKACGYYVLVETDEVEVVSAGGIVIAGGKDVDRMEEAQSTGRIVDIGPMAFKGLESGCTGPDDWGVKVGDRVEFATYDGRRPVSAGKDSKLRLITDQKILAVIP